MYPYDEDDYPCWCLVTRPEHFRMVIDKARDIARLDLVVAEVALPLDDAGYRVFFRTESLAIWYRRKNDLRTYLVLELEYDNWLRVADGRQIVVVEGITDDEIMGWVVSPE